MSVIALLLCSAVYNVVLAMVVGLSSVHPSVKHQSG